MVRLKGMKMDEPLTYSKFSIIKIKFYFKFKIFNEADRNLTFSLDLEKEEKEKDQKMIFKRIMSKLPSRVLT